LVKNKKKSKKNRKVSNRKSGKNKKSKMMKAKRSKQRNARTKQKKVKIRKKVKSQKKVKRKSKRMRIRRIKREVSESLGEIKATIYAEPEKKIEPTIENKEVILQNIGFELATVKQLLDRINRQLSVIESRMEELLEE